MLSHPNIVNIYDVSVRDDLKYIVMEYVAGITLKKYMEKKRARSGASRKLSAMRSRFCARLSTLILRE